VGLAAVALVTRRMRLGTMVTPLPRRRPWKLARETATLDRLSSGRLILGVGIGLGHTEWDDLGEETDPKSRGEMLDEALQVLTKLWSGETFSFQGEHYQVMNARFLPTPLQPHIPIWVGGFWPNKAPMRRAARWDGAYPLFNVWQDPAKLTAFKEAVAFLREQKPTAQPFDILAIGSTRSSDDCEAVHLYQEAGATWWMEAIDPWSYGWPDHGPWPIEVMRQRVRMGPPRCCRGSSHS
jgi:alkanesulfonate monooxygenase SsuD/methylene tetrahydromethanopterin reductase-like flavin-dependent oxidoreductase (luciferase family)